MAISKRYKKITDGLDRNKSYTVEEAVKLIKSRAVAKFDETIELSLNLGVDPKHADQHRDFQNNEDRAGPRSSDTQPTMKN